MKTVYIIMGVSGTGKSTIGTMLAQKLDVPFFDGDDFHPEANIQKMASGQPLNDEDRYDWLVYLNELANKYIGKGAVIVCSALKSSYREILKNGLGDSLQFIHLVGSFELIQSRMEKRTSHFMPPNLLESQFATLEPPQDAITVSIEPSPENVVANIFAILNP